jgi:hypothetical protein
MSNAQIRTRSDRVAALPKPERIWQRWYRSLRDKNWWGRWGIAAAAAVFVVLACRSWEPAFPYRSGGVTSRDLVARVPFEVPNPSKTELMREQRRREVPVYYANRTQPLTQVRERLKDQLFTLLRNPDLASLDKAGLATWDSFLTNNPVVSAHSREEVWNALQQTLAMDTTLQGLDEAVQAAMLTFYEHGLLVSLEHTIEEGNQRSIRVYQASRPEDDELVPVDRVRIPQIEPDLQERLTREFSQRFGNSEAPLAALAIDGWLAEQLKDCVTLTYDSKLSEEARRAAADQVEPVADKFFAGTSVLIRAGQPIGVDELKLLRAEHEAVRHAITTPGKIARLLATFGMLSALYVLCSVFIYWVGDRRLLAHVSGVARLLSLAVVTMLVCRLAMGEQLRLEVVPIVMAACAATVVYGRPLAMLLMVSVCLAITLLLGQGLREFVVLIAAALTTILLTGRIRTRTRLLAVGLGAAGVTAATAIGTGILSQQLWGIDPGVRGDLLGVDVHWWTPWQQLGREALWHAGSAMLAGFMMTGFLPLVERLFGVQTDLTLLELGDASHPLLRQLAQRAPGTYNHSINVASIAEPAAEAIGANGLLVRVGAYFHDIGKLFKPNYFIENQGLGPNQHDSLQPAMSTLVIIAHVKDGADLARSHHLPQSIIDFIEQHHGTTLVEYFYRQAAERSQRDAESTPVSDRDFRYPGPKPQSLEAAVLMLADTVESASRALVEPTPARIKGLVEDVSMKKLSDGQFDECGLTLLQLNVVKQSLVKSLTAIYHARVKYPGQQSA